MELISLVFLIIFEVNKMLWIILLLVVLFLGLEFNGHVINKIFVPVAIGTIAIPPIIYYLLFKNFTALTAISITLGIFQVIILLGLYLILRKIVVNS